MKRVRKKLSDMLGLQPNTLPDILEHFPPTPRTHTLLLLTALIRDLQASIHIRTLIYTSDLLTHINTTTSHHREVIKLYCKFIAEPIIMPVVRHAHNTQLEQFPNTYTHVTFTDIIIKRSL